MKHAFLFVIFLMALTNHQSVQGQNLVVGNSDVIGYPASNPNHTFLLEADRDHFFRLSSSNNNNPIHPLIKDVPDTNGLIFFIRYNEMGEALESNHILGTSSPTKAFTFEGGLQLLGSAYNDVDANGQVISLNDADNLEFLASYDPNCSLKLLRNIWNLPRSVYPNSNAAQDPRDGSIYLYGASSQDFLEVDGFGPVGEKWEGDFIYLLKFNQELKVEWAYTAGYNTDTITGYFPSGDLRVTPGVNGNLVLTGTYYSNGSKPQFGSDALPSVDNGQGVFALGVNSGGDQTWIRAGENQNWEYNARIEKGFSLSNGDFLLTGTTSSGYFKLGEAEFMFEGGQGFQNQFVFRIGPDGSVRWLKPLSTMGMSGIKKSTQSEEFKQDIYADAILWNEDVLYMTGTYQSSTFVVADKPLPVTYTEQFFIASINPEDGHENWGYGFSSDFIQLHGFDVDRTGHVSIMGTSADKQDFNGNSQISGPAERLIFHMGLDYRGRLLWYNNAFLQNQNFQVRGSDLEVLPNGATFAAIQVSAPENLDFGDQTLLADFPYTNWLVGLNSTMQLSGFVKDEAGSPLYPGYVRAYRSAPSRAYPVIDSVQLNDAGAYHFDKLSPGNYTFQVVPNRDAYPDQVPYYLGNHPTWTSAEFNDFGPANNTTTLDVSVPAVPRFTPEDGSGSILGKVSYEGNLKSTMGRPVKKASVMLLKKGSKKSNNETGELLGYFETDDLGNYEFKNVPNGDYILIVDIAGLPMVQVYEVAIEGSKIVSDLDYEVGTDGIDMTGYVGVEALKEDGFLLFPNPGDGKILINSTSLGEYEVSVYGTDGRLVIAPLRMKMPGQTTLDISQEDQGLYLIVLNGPEESVSMKYIKK